MLRGSIVLRRLAFDLAAMDAEALASGELDPAVAYVASAPIAVDPASIVSVRWSLEARPPLCEVTYWQPHGWN